MAERSLRVRISLDTTALKAEAEAAAAAFRGIGTAAQTGGRTAAAGMNAAANSVTAGHRAAATAQNELAANSVRASNAMGVGLTSAGARVRFGALSATSIIAFSAFEAAKAVLKIGMAYETNMNVLQAVTHASTAEMEQAGATARALGKDISIPATSASDAAVAMETLAKGGFTVQQSMEAAKGTLQLAAAAGIDAATAADIESRALNAFTLGAGQAGHVADLLANVSIAATGNMNDFALGLKQAGEVAHGAGISIDDTATSLGIFANAGLAGSDGGTSFRTMLMRLEAPTSRNQKGLDALGVSAWDANGKFVGMRSVMEQLHVAQGKMTTQQFTMAAAMGFGHDAVRAATVAAYAGAAGWDEMSLKMANGGGAAQLSSARMKGLTGAVENFKNQAQETALAIYDKLGPSVAGLVNAASTVISVVGPAFSFLFGIIGDVIKVFGELPGPVALGVLGMILFVSKFGAISGTVTTVIGTFKNFMTAMDGVRARTAAARIEAEMAGVTLSRTGAAMGTAEVATGRLGTAFKALAIGTAVGLALTGIAWAISLFTSNSKDAKDATELWNTQVGDLSDTLDKATGAVTAMTRSKVIDWIGPSALNSWTQLGIDTSLVVDAMVGVPGAVDKSTAAIEQLATKAFVGSQEFKDYGAQMATAGVSAKDLADAMLNNNFDAVNAKLKGLGVAYSQTSDGMIQVTDLSTGDVMPAFQGIQAATVGLTNAYHAQNGENQKVQESFTAWSAKAKAAAGDTNTTATSVTELSKQTGGMVPIVDEASGVVGLLAGKAGEAASGANALGSATGSAADAQKIFKQNVQDSITKLDELQNKQHEAADAALLAADDVRSFGKAMADVPQAQRDAAAAQDAVTAAQIKYTDATNKRVTKDYSAQQKALDVAAANRDLAAAQSKAAFATEGVDAAMQKLGVVNDKEIATTTTLAQTAYNAARAQGDDLATATNKAEAAAKAHVDQLIAERMKMGETIGQATAYVTGLGLIPHDIATSVNLSTTDAEQRLADYKQHFNELIALMQAHGTVASGATGGVGYTALGFHTGTGTILKADGGIVEAAKYSGTTAAASGMIRQSSLVNGGANILWGEPETGWEAYVSGKPSQLNRNRAVLREAASRLGIPGYDGDSASNYRPSMGTMGASMTQNVVPAQAQVAPSVTVTPPRQDFTFRVFLDGAEVTSRVRIAVLENNAEQGRALMAS